MNHIRTLSFITLATTMFLTPSFGQDNKISHYERHIIKGIDPYEDGVVTKYQKDYRVLVWNDELIKDYKYSNEEFDKLGYKKVNTGTSNRDKTSTVYRNCDKGIVCTVTKWHGKKL